MEDCVFCKIIKKEIPSETIKETKNLIAIKDIHPQADIHILIIPKNHTIDVNDLEDSVWTDIKKLGLELVKEKGITNFRMTTNAGDAAAVHHMHMHLLGEITSDRKI
jgi:histidine triad (HIT) family protein